VATRLVEIQHGYVGEPLNYFYGVAKNVYRESLRKDKVPTIKPPTAAPSDEDKERDFACLETCIAGLQAEDRDLVIEYYRYEKRIKIDHRKSLAQQMGLGMNALRIRACRIRSDLQKCVGACLAGTAAEFAK
jgi:DNA-directed RNA polymerase specialized sigma24 family protein